ncbi:hypothetical protein GRF29_103g63361 [Pseudopithomyces chartarum]|uniref:Uncharacterized protein n=1 Tax=Pseudopithomyces chartarum TaxID=1892770 RepID=A0AAN6LTG4_9PLEO|nr:hypothetical protein GRF29_103g63361 [Pseudopithomyces chartarum]
MFFAPIKSMHGEPERWDTCPTPRAHGSTALVWDRSPRNSSIKVQDFDILNPERLSISLLVRTKVVHHEIVHVYWSAARAWSNKLESSVAPNPRDVSNVVAWTYAALAHATITVSNSTSELTYLCKNFDTLSSRYYTAFASPDGDVAQLAKDAICAASKSSNPSPLPVPQNMLWYMKMYTGGIFNMQAYSAKTPSTKWYFDMCYYVEASLLKGLWAPCRDSTDEGGVDVEGGFCVAAGYFGKGPFSKYTDAAQSADSARQANILMSKFMASVFKVIAGEKKQIEYVCNNWKRYEPGFGKTSLVASTVKEMANWVAAE